MHSGPPKHVNGRIDVKVSDLKPCAGCGLGVSHGGQLDFYTVTLTQEILLPKEVRQLAGLEMMIGNVVVARALSPVTDISRETFKNTILLCQNCLLIKQVPAHEAWPVEKETGDGVDEYE